MKRNAFTLIELLVVIAIIAVLASIAIPVYGSVQEKGRATQCASNLRQLGIGFQAYLNDHDDDMFTKAGDASGSWPDVLHERYVKSWKTFRSPFDRPTADRPNVETGSNVPVSYGINSNLFDVNASKFESPSELIMAAPAVEPAADIAFTGRSSQNVSVMPPGGARKLGTHSNRNQINVLYCDSHVTSLLFADFGKSSAEDGRRRWFPETVANQ
ncbi:MAG: prepilin-type N-terminal cleavage/methylation domain-containing protein [Chthoniobacteraceae bacterium]